MNWLKKIFNSKEMEWFLVITVLGVAVVAHGYNMFGYPYYESDEGTYMAQAWAIISKGQLAPYTYWYDHAPVGWMFIALWIKLTGGLATFGYTLNSGRMFMFVLHLASTFMLYIIGKKVTGHRLVGLLAGLVFSLSPLAIYFQRRVLLDNIMVFWVLLTFTILLYYRNKLRYILLSAVTFAIAVLSKESAIFFMPFFLGMVFFISNKRHRLFAVIKWIAISLSLISLYFTYAYMKGEFFPSGTLFGGTTEHVSLLSTLDFQANRSNVSIFSQSSTFWHMVSSWITDDAFIIYAGAVSTVITLLYAIKNKAARILGAFALSYWLFLMRGGLVLEFYVIPLIPVVALTIGYSVWKTAAVIATWRPKVFRVFSIVPLLALAAGITYMVGYASSHNRYFYSIYQSNQTNSQVAATEWILAQERPNAFYDIDNFAYLDLQTRNKGNFKNAEYYWKVDWDKDIKTKVLNNDPNNIDYIVFTPLIGGDIGSGHLPITGKALSNSNPIISFPGDGWYVQIWGVKNKSRILETAWTSYKKAFIFDGQVIDDQRKKSTTSEGESYAMLQAVWMNDKASFDKVYDWSKRNLQQSNNTFAWKYENGKIIDKSNATDADQDIALALLFASKRFNEPTYEKEALKIIQGIWNANVVTVRNKPYIGAGNWANKSNEVIMNPSYLSPAHYRIFADVDKSHPWNGLVDTSYDVLNQSTTATLDGKKGVLPPEWIAVNKSTLKVQQPEEPQPRSTEYGYNAFRTPWRIAVDYKWNKDPKAEKYLASLSFLETEYQKTGKLTAAYKHDGEVWENYESVAAYGGNIGYFVVENPQLAQTIYKDKMLKKFFEDENKGYWDDPKNYYTQNWAWFGSALATDNLPNLWTPNAVIKK